MKYGITLGNKYAEVNFSDDLTVEQLNLVEDMLLKAIDTRRKELKEIRNNLLPLNARITDMYPPLTGRTQNILLRDRKETIQDVLNCTPTELENIRMMGKKSLEEVKERFSIYGKFKEERRAD